MTRLLWLAAAVVAGTTPLCAQTRETEPNNSPATANTVALGGQAAGAIDVDEPGSPNHDPDYWTFDATSGDTLAFEMHAVFMPWLRLIAPDGTTVLADVGAPDHGYYSVTLHYVVQTTGRYFLFASDEDVGGGPDSYYTIDLYTNRFPKPPCAVAGEREPNDSFTTAVAVTLGSTIQGIICPEADKEFFRFHATQRTRLQIEVDRDPASPSPWWGYPALTLFANGLPFRDRRDWSSGNTLEYWVPDDRDFYALLHNRNGGVNNKYTITFRSLGPVPSGPGDPVTVRADSLDSPLALAAGPDGDLYVSDWSAGILRITTSGHRSVFVDKSVMTARGLAFDVSGNVLALAPTYGVYSISPSGERRLLISDPSGFVMGMTVGPDGSVWLTDLWDHAIRQYDRHGQLLHTYDVHQVLDGPQDVAISPSGELYFSAGSAIYRLVGDTPLLFVRDTTLASENPPVSPIGGLAFDVEGNLYVGSSNSGGIVLYDRNAVPLHSPFGWVPGAPAALAFGRDPDGSTNNRLFVLAGQPFFDPSARFHGFLAEVNPSGVVAPGWPIGFQASLQVSTEQAVAELLHPGTLSALQLDALDQRGNKNGRYDVGDLRAFLMANGVLASRRAAP